MDKHRLSLIVIGALAGAILLGGWILGIQPQIDRIDSANEQTASIRQINDVQQTKNAALAADNEKLGDYKSDLSAKQDEIPAGRSQQDLINQIDAAANSSDVTVKALSFDVAADYTAPAGVEVPSVSSGSLIDIPLTMSVEGPRAKLEDFLAKLQTSSRIVTIHSSDYTSDDETERLDLTGVTWVLMPVS